MRRTRRVILKITTIPLAAVVASACSQSSPAAPTPPPTSSNSPPPTPTAQIISPPASYLFAIKVGDRVGFENVFTAFAAAKVESDTQRTLSGLKVIMVGPIKSASLKIDINGVPFCTTAGLTPVPPQAIVACYIEDGRKVTGSCISDRPF